MTTACQSILPQVSERLPGLRWFSPGGCVLSIGELREVYVGGLLVGRYPVRDRAARNALLVGLAEDRHMHLGQLAEAFEISVAGLRVLRRVYEQHGLGAVMARAPGGRPTRVTPTVRRLLEKHFEQGESAAQAHRRVSRRHRLSESSARVVHKAWRERSSALAVPRPAPAATTSGAQATLPLPGLERVAAETTTEPTAAAEAMADASPSSAAPTSASAGAPPSGAAGAGVPACGTGPTSGRAIQHVGSWMLLGQLERYGLPSLAMRLGAEAELSPEATRVAVEALAIALAIGEACVEGVRRIATPTAATLLRTTRPPCADAVRTTLHQLADEQAPALHLGMAGRYLAIARATRQAGPAIFYVDNHLRPYTGKHVVRHGWRMQDKRVRPGTTDYYVHDADGRPVLRSSVPSHDSLVERLRPLAEILRVALGPDERILLAFDRAGAHAAHLAALRDEGYEFVTYERRPFQVLSASAFDQVVTFDDGDAGETITYCETRANLGAGRGRVRRIAMRMPDGRQVNLLGAGVSSAIELIEVMRHRWRQENGFKHGVERWGINQLDGRRVEHYDPDTVVPNPARRRLDHSLRLAVIADALARRELAMLAADDPRRERQRARFEADLARAIEQQKELAAQRPHAPVRAPLKDTPLAGKLVYHPGLYKAALDAIRIACANAEADLAGLLAPHLPRPAEAKQTLANLLGAPGDIRVTQTAIEVTLAPAATASERQAFGHFYAQLNARRLRLPGDPSLRTLRFRPLIS